MLHKAFPIMVVAALATAACGGDRDGDDDMTQRDTSLFVVPDTQMVERTTTWDTIRNPDLDRDTLRGDTLRDTIPR
jgi:hypothetical protein